MQISHIRFGRLISTGDYENQRLEVEAQVDRDEDPEQVLTQLQAFVNEKLGITCRELGRACHQELKRLDVSYSHGEWLVQSLSGLQCPVYALEQITDRPALETLLTALGQLTPATVPLPPARVDETDDLAF